MSWIQKLCETYECCSDLDDRLDARPWPLSHFVKQAHVEVVLDGEGNFRKGRIRKLEWNESPTLIPATERSAGRTAGIAPHPLCEEIGYMASDLPEQSDLKHIRNYLLSLSSFCDAVSPESTTKSHLKLREICQGYMQWLGMLDTDFAVADAGEADTFNDEEEETPKIGDLEKMLTGLNENGQIPNELQCVPDYFNKQNLRFAKKHTEYFRLLEAWCSSEFQHPKALAVLGYLKKGTLWSDLDCENIFPLSISNRSGQKTKLDNDKVFIRWRIESLDEPCSGTWDDKMLMDAWAGFDAQQNSLSGFCMATGRQTRLAQNHSRFLRWPGDGAKIISANDFNGFTFKGRFTDDKADYEKQVCSVGFEVSQKAHNALRWLIARQGSRNGDLVVVSWAVAGKPAPDPFHSTIDLFETAPVEEIANASSDTAQSFALRLKRAIAGYRTRLDPDDDIVVMGIDSATPGRMGITFYRELKGSDFLARVEAWHSQCAWPQDVGKGRKFVGAPASRDIAESAYGRWDDLQRRIIIDEKLLKSAVERLLPCIIDGQSIPRDLVESVCRRATNRIGFKKSEAGYEDQWEKCLGIACALFKKYHNERGYHMELESDRMTRDYLYGRLLALADNIEGYALRLTDEGKKRDTTATRLMQRFATRPFSTWANIELALIPYMTRLKAGSDKSAGFLAKRKKLLDEVMTSLDKIAERTSDAPLTGEFLLGFHTQRQNFWSKSEADQEESTEQTVEN